MKDLIKEIIDANDKVASEAQSVEQMKMDSSNKIASILNERREEYIDKARMNIKVIKKIEDSKASMEIDKIRSDCNETLDRLDSFYAAHKDEWISEVFNRIISLDTSSFSNLE